MTAMEETLSDGIDEWTHFSIQNEMRLSGLLLWYQRSAVLLKMGLNLVTTVPIGRPLNTGLLNSHPSQKGV